MMNELKIYNEEQKIKYLDYDKKNYKANLLYFQRLAPIEMELEKDVANMSPVEFKKSLESLGIAKRKTIGHAHSLITSYVEWAFSNGFVVTKEQIEQVLVESIDNMSSIQTQMLKDPQHVTHILETAIDESFAGRACRDKLIVWLMYIGMTSEEIQYIKKNDVDYDNKNIKTHLENIYVVDNMVLHLCEIVSGMTYIEKASSRTPLGQVDMELVDNNYLFRGILGKKGKTNESVKITTILKALYDTIKKYNKETGENLKISATNVRESGLFYKVYTLEKSGENISKDFFQNYLVETQFDKSVTEYKAREYYADYIDWKAAFRLI